MDGNAPDKPEARGKVAGRCGENPVPSLLGLSLRETVRGPPHLKGPGLL